ncbi:uncharacterized protein LOC135218022 [Macrobrachium nipponense]|uniref:uncharacterized protein LOC135218022 n=1 Tax=Macrobrachium nipponense TaxID=159736 RepID=UPI0030C82C55
MQKHAADIREDSPLAEYVEPAPWKPELFNINYTVLPASKEACTIQQLKQAAQDSIRKTTATNEYFTDGSVDLSIPAAAAGVYSTSLKGNWRLSDNASTLQTELIAIAKALEDSQHKLGNTTIHTDSKGAIQAITKGKAKENIKLLTSIWAIANIHQTRNRQITLNWIPSHIGIQGNEEADSLAKSGLHINNIGIKISHSLTQLKSKAAAYCQVQEESKVRRAVFGGSNTAKWYVDTTSLQPHDIPKDMSRALAVIIHRLRLGYQCTWQKIVGDPRPCKYCERIPEEPLEHYLLDCPET